MLNIVGVGSNKFNLHTSLRILLLFLSPSLFTSFLFLFYFRFIISSVCIYFIIYFGVVATNKRQNWVELEKWNQIEIPWISYALNWLTDLVYFITFLSYVLLLFFLFCSPSSILPFIWFDILCSVHVKIKRKKMFAPIELRLWR